MAIADHHAFIQGFQNGLLLGQQPVQLELLTDGLGGRLHGTQSVGIEIVRRGGERQHANHDAFGIAHRRGGALAMPLPQAHLPVFTAEHIHQPLFKQAACGAVGALNLFTQDAADRRHVRAAVVKGDAMGIGQVDVTVGIIGQQIFHDAARHGNQLGIVRQNRQQLVRRWRVINKLIGIDAVFTRASPGLQDRLAYPTGLAAFIKRLPPLPKQAVPFTGFRPFRQAEDRIALVFDRHQAGGCLHGALRCLECNVHFIDM